MTTSTDATSCVSTHTTYTVVYPPHIERILQAVAKAFSVPVRDLAGASRTRRVTEARQAAMVLMRDAGRMSSVEIGMTLGRDHTTILSGWSRCEAKCVLDGDYRWMFEEAKQALKRGEE